MVSLGNCLPLGPFVCDVSLCFVTFPYGLSGKGPTSWLSCVRCFIVFLSFTIWCLWERAYLLALLCAMFHCVFCHLPYGVSGKGLTSWLSCVRCFIVFFVIYHMVSLGKGLPLGSLVCDVSLCFCHLPYGVSGKGLTSWLSCVRCFIVFFVIYHMVSLGQGLPLGSLVCDVSLCFLSFTIWCLWERAYLLALLCAMFHCVFCHLPYGVSGKGLTSWLSCVRCFIVFFVIFPYGVSGKGLTSLLCVMFHCVFITFSHGVSGKGLTSWLSCVSCFIVFCHIPKWCLG